MANQNPGDGAHSSSRIITDPREIENIFKDSMGPDGLPLGRINDSLNEMSGPLPSGDAPMPPVSQRSHHPQPPAPERQNNVGADEFLRRSGGPLLNQLPGGSRDGAMSTASLDYGGHGGSYTINHSIPSTGSRSGHYSPEEQGTEQADYSEMQQAMLSFGRSGSGSSMME